MAEKLLLMLEDDAERVARFRATFPSVAPGWELMIWRDARRMAREAFAFLDRPCLLSLDHDLDPESPGDEPGDGMELVRALVAQPIVRPVIIHSSNRERSTWMGGELELAGWRYWSVYPLGDDWIEVDWARLVRRLVRRAERA
jgi:hypothetical protein